jgi:hypothetical protein
MQIRIVAKKIGLSVDAIRFYERNALLPRAPRTQGGFRQYADVPLISASFHFPFIVETPTTTAANYRAAPRQPTVVRKNSIQGFPTQ